MANEKLNFTSKDSVKLFARTLLNKTNIRIEERIVTELNESSSDKQSLSAKAIYALLGNLNQADESVNTGITGITDGNSEHAESIEALNTHKAEQEASITVIEEDITELGDTIDAFTHLTTQVVVGELDTVVTEPRTDVLYLQKTVETDPFWTVYMYTESIGWISVGDTEIDLSIYWSKDETAQMREQLGIHDTEAISDETIASIVDEAFDLYDSDYEEEPEEPEEPEVPLEPITITEDNRHLVGYTDDITNLVIPSVVTDENGVKYQVTTIGSSAFSSCKNLTNVTIPSTVTSIGYAAFSNCTNLTSVTIPEGVTEIGSSAFSSCKNLTNVTIPSTVTKIGYAAFSNCTNLTEVIIPEGVTIIDDDTFSNCSKLTGIIIPSTVTRIGEGAFNECIRLITVYYTGTEEQWNDIYIDDEDNTELSSAYKEYNYDKSELPSEPETRLKLIDITQENRDLVGYTNTTTDLVIPSVVTIKDDVQRKVATISNEAFYECENLTSVTIPSTVTKIGSGAFEGCTGLTTVYYTGTKEQWNAISIKRDNDPLTNAAKLYNYDPSVPHIAPIVINISNRSLIGCTSDTVNLVIPDTVTVDGVEYQVTRIGNKVFYEHENLSSITIPASVTTIGESAFEGCMKLNTVYYTGTKEQWNAISIESDNDRLKNARKIYNYQG